MSEEQKPELKFKSYIKVRRGHNLYVIDFTKQSCFKIDFDNTKDMVEVDEQEGLLYFTALNNKVAGDKYLRILRKISENIEKIKKELENGSDSTSKQD